MKKLSSTLPNMILSLGIITLVAGALLGLMSHLTQEEIAKQTAKAQQEAMKKVLPDYDNDPTADRQQIKISGNECMLYPAYSKEKFVGAAVETGSMNGFNGEIKIMVGFNADGSVRNYDVLQQAETPGLGSKMGVWFKDPAEARSILGKNPAQTSFYVTKDTEQHGEIDAITAATISSRAFLESVRSAHKAFEQYKKETER